MDWRKVTASAPPPQLEDAVMAFSPVDGAVYLHGGRDGSGVVRSETWRYASGEWAELPSAGGPFRVAHAMAYHEGRDEIVMFGGRDESNLLQGDAWIFDPIQGTWSAGPVGGPMPRERFSMAFDRATGRVVLHGGMGQMGPTNDTWAYDGDWASAGGGTPPAFHGGRLAVHAGLGGLVYWDGTAMGPATTYLYDGTWSLFSSEAPGADMRVQPTKRVGHVMAEVGCQVVLFGGHQPMNQSNLMFDTWILE
jgi:hypothetical protein